MLALPLPTGIHAKVFDTFATFLRLNPALARIVKTWVVYSGDPAQDQIPETIKLLPCVRLMPSAGPVRRLCTGGFGPRETTLEITIETAVEGTKWADSANLAEAITQAIQPDDHAKLATVKATLATVGVTDIDAIEPPTTINDTGSAYAVATGKVRFTIWF